jgi:hypothetical protein
MASPRYKLAEVITHNDESSVEGVRLLFWDFHGPDGEVLGGHKDSRGVAKGGDLLGTSNLPAGKKSLKNNGFPEGVEISCCGFIDHLGFEVQRARGRAESKLDGDVARAGWGTDLSLKNNFFVVAFLDDIAKGLLAVFTSGVNKDGPKAGIVLAALVAVGSTESRVGTFINIHIEEGAEDMFFFPEPIFIAVKGNSWREIVVFGKLGKGRLKVVNVEAPELKEVDVDAELPALFFLPAVVKNKFVGREVASDENVLADEGECGIDAFPHGVEVGVGAMLVETDKGHKRVRTLKGGPVESLLLVAEGWSR